MRLLNQDLVEHPKATEVDEGAVLAAEASDRLTKVGDNAEVVEG